MPPRKNPSIRRKPTFAEPGTPASNRPYVRSTAVAPGTPSTSTAAPPVLTTAAARSSTTASGQALPSPASLLTGHLPFPIGSKPVKRRRDVGSEIDTTFAEPGGLQSYVGLFDREHLLPITRITLGKHEMAKDLWRGFFSRYLGSDEQAEATLQREAPLPDLQALKAFFHFVAVRGESHLDKTRRGWAYPTTLSFVGATFGMLKRCGVQAASQNVRTQIHAAVREWAMVDKSLQTGHKKKTIVRESDLLDFLAAAMRPEVRIDSNWLRIQLIHFTQKHYEDGHRVGDTVEAAGYKGTRECVLWGDTEWIATGWTEGLGLEVETYWTFRYMKGMRLDEGKNITTASRTLTRTHIVFDRILTAMAIAAALGVFEDDIIECFKTKGRIERFPFIFRIKAEWKGMPVFLLADKSTPSTASSISHLAGKVAKYLGWQSFQLRSFRYGFASAMATKLPKHLFTHFMGHRSNSKYGFANYQTDHRQIDMTGHRFANQGEDQLDTLHWRASVSYDPDKPNPTSEEPAHISVEVLKLDPVMQDLITTLQNAEDAVYARFGKYSVELDENDLGSDAAVTALDAWSEVISHYTDLGSQGNRAALGAQLKNGERLRSASVASLESTDSKHRPRQFSRRSASVASSHMSVDSGRMSVDSSRMSVGSSRMSVDLDRAGVDQVSTRELDPKNDPPLAALGISQQSQPSTAPSTHGILFADDDFLMHVASTLDTISGRHPFLAAIDDDRENPRFAVIYRYIALLRADDVRDKGQCIWCLHNESISKEKREYDHRDHYSQHIWACESLHNPGTIRCNVCGSLVVDPESITEEDDPDGTGALAIEAALNSHFEACFERVKGMLAGEDDSLDDEDLEAEGKGKSKVSITSGPTQLSVASRLGGSRRLMRRYLCPICVFDVDKPWPQRLNCWMSVEKLYQHLHSHYSNLSRKKIVRSGINYSTRSVCNFPPCRDVKLATTAEIINHLHEAHRYDLVMCSREHDGTHCPGSCSLTLEGDFMYFTDAQVDKSENNAPMPSVCLVDHRKNDMRRRARDRICAGSTNDKDEPKSQPNESAIEITAEPADTEEIPSSIEPSLQPAVESATSSSASSPFAQLEQCLSQFIIDTPRFKEYGLLEKFRKEDVDLEMLRSMNCRGLREAFPELTFGVAKSLLDFVKVWT
ncbi:hypothetical protein HYDPIDRAFT_29929 [Hydnomerulius pinastri MD-312]|uniref:Uncharacterized protein n=1 Tax=Hydnomerulius pinastri MD-312 TaxID=994086 RepID=A0A0C9WDV1_9AGAM|nr:hypothetical protein HYDPIDRAFT_29929 [Hydnomerulius pinastri MD-312]